MMSVVGIAAGEREAARADVAAAVDICANVLSCLLTPFSGCFREPTGIVGADGAGGCISAMSPSFGIELLMLELALLMPLDEELMVLVALLPLPVLLLLLDLDDFELLSRCEDDDDEEDDDGSLSWFLFVLDTLFTLLLYLSLSLLLLFEDDDELVLLGFPLVTLLFAPPVLIPEIPIDEDDVDWLLMPVVLFALPVRVEEDDVDTELVELFEALDDFRCLDEDEADEEPLCSPGKRLLDFMLPLLMPDTPECSGTGGGSSSFSGEEGPSLEFVS